MLALVAVHSVMVDIALHGFFLTSYQAIGTRVLRSEDSSDFQVTLLFPGLTNDSLNRRQFHQQPR